MVKITRLEHLQQVPEKEIVPHIKNLLEYLLEEYKDAATRYTKKYQNLLDMDN